MNKSRPSQQQQPTTSPTREDVGLGTAYERLAAYRLIETWVADQPLRTAFEGPIDGMAGISGLHLLPLARRGTRVTVASTSQEASDWVRQTYARCGLTGNLEAVCLDQPPKAGTFDLVLSFNALPLVENWRGYLDALAGCTGRFLLAVLTNPHSYGVGLAAWTPPFERGERPPSYLTTSRCERARSSPSCGGSATSCYRPTWTAHGGPTSSYPWVRPCARGR